MNICRKLAICFLPLVILAGCKKRETTPETSAPKPTPSTPPAPATAATSAATPTSSTADAGSSAETTAKMAAADWAIKQDEIKNGPHGQWAAPAKRASTHNN